MCTYAFSKFDGCGTVFRTSWVQKIAVRISLTELRRRKWRNVSLDDILDEGASAETLQRMADPSVSPEGSALQSDMMSRVLRLISAELTDKQRQAMVAIILHGLPMSEVARQMNTNRNALYKLLHDARLRLKKRLEAEGLSPNEVLASFNNT